MIAVGEVERVPRGLAGQSKRETEKELLLLLRL